MHFLRFWRKFFCEGFGKDSKLDSTKNRKSWKKKQKSQKHQKWSLNPQDHCSEFLEISMKNFCEGFGRICSWTFKNILKRDQSQWREFLTPVWTVVRQAALDIGRRQRTNGFSMKWNRLLSQAEKTIVLPLWEVLLVGFFPDRGQFFGQNQKSPKTSGRHLMHFLRLRRKCQKHDMLSLSGTDLRLQHYGSGTFITAVSLFLMLV